uniref:Uncharacterized protein n=1 Tax=Nannospalax galili TaxID=1026970 RepID=A0A8C6RRP0_NANGA
MKSLFMFLGLWALVGCFSLGECHRRLQHLRPPPHPPYVLPQYLQHLLPIAQRKP